MAAIVATSVTWSTAQVATVATLTAATTAAVTATIVASATKVRNRLQLEPASLQKLSEEIPRHLYDSSFNFCKETRHIYISPVSKYHTIYFFSSFLYQVTFFLGKHAEMCTFRIQCNGPETR